MSAINMTITGNGDAAHATSGDALVDAFDRLRDTTPNEVITNCLSAAWEQSPIDTIKIMFYVLDVRDGKGCNETFRRAVKWLGENHPQTLYKNLQWIARFGYYKDLPEILMTVLMDEDEVALMKNYNNANKMVYGRKRARSDKFKGKHIGIDKCREVTQQLRKLYEKLRQRCAHLLAHEKEGLFATLHAQVVSLFVTALNKDLETMEKDMDSNSTNVAGSLAAKWLPSEHMFHDRILGIYSSVATAIALSQGKSLGTKDSKKFLRAAVVTPLRRRCRITESLMSRNQWSTIPYERVPGNSMQRNQPSFTAHDGERFEQFLADVKLGKFKMNVASLKPYDIMHLCMGSTVPETQTRLAEAQWEAQVQALREHGALTSTMAIVDVSGSMQGRPMEVAVALGLLTSALTAEPWLGSIITFHDRPQFYQITEDASLRDQVHMVMRAPWGMNTDYVAVFEMILERARQHSLKPEDMVHRLITISDMQFDASGGSRFTTSYEVVKRKYADAGYAMPKMVFWNVSERHFESAPARADEEGTVLLSGFSGNLFKLVLEGADLAEEDFELVDLDGTTRAVKEKSGTTVEVMRKAIDHERYLVLEV